MPLLEQLIEARLLEAEAENEARLQAAVAMTGAEATVEGQSRGLREGPRIVLRQRLSTIPPAVDARIVSATADDLDALLARAVTISTVDAL